MFYGEFGIVVDDKTFIPWEKFFEITRDLTNVKVEETLRKAAADRASYDDMKLFQETDKGKLNELAMFIGLKDQSKVAIKQIKSNIRTKLDRIKNK